MLSLQTGLKRTSTNSLLQAPDCRSGVCLPYGRRSVAPRTIPVLIFSKNSPPRTNIRKMVTGSPHQTRVRGSETRILGKVGGFFRGGQKKRTRRGRLCGIPAHRRAASWGLGAQVRCQADVFWLRICSCPPPPSHLFFRLLLMHARRRRMARRNPDIDWWLCNQWSQTWCIVVAARVKLLVIGCLVLCLLLLSDEFSSLHDFGSPYYWRPRHSSPSSFSSLQCCADMGHASCWESTPSIMLLSCRLQ